MRRGRGRPPAHRAQPQRHRHDDVPHPAARVHRGPGVGARWSCATALLALAERHTRTPSTARTPTPSRRSRRPSRTTCWRSIEQLERDTARLAAAFESTNRNPLGACAITGTGFPIDRNRTSELLGFSGPTCNTYGSIATVDYLLESVSATSILIVGLGRVIQDLLLWCTMEFGYLRLSDGFVQGSSIMPQKRNPVALEHARAIGSKAVGQAQAIVTAVHNTPFGDIVDTEDDLQPLVASMFGDAIRMVTLVAAAMRLADFNVEHLASRAAYGGTTLTELADTLVRDHGLPFRSAHAIAALAAEGANRGSRRRLVGGARRGVERHPGPHRSNYDEAALTEIMSPAHFVKVRTTYGGPAPAETGRAIGESRRLLESDRESWTTPARAARSRRRQPARRW